MSIIVVLSCSLEGKVVVVMVLIEGLVDISVYVIWMGVKWFEGSFNVIYKWFWVNFSFCVFELSMMIWCYLIFFGLGRK